MIRHSHTIVIVGGGFSGTVLAANLLRRPPPCPARIVLIEPSAQIGGAAYATRDYPYLLNVPAGRMSAESDAPDAFLEFARLRIPSATAHDFLPRALYGTYLRALLVAAERLAPPRVTFERVQAEVVGLTRSDERWQVRLREGGELAADRVVLACGNPPPATLPGLQAVRDHPRHVQDACRHNAREPLRGHVLLIGTGLTMADAALVATQDSDVVVHAISRHGLLPPSQVANQPSLRTLNAMHLLDGAGPVRELLRVARALASDAADLDADWRDVVTAIRERAPAIWRGLDARERGRFLRHLRPYWDAHRHRLPPPTHERLAQLRQEGRLHIHAGRILDARADGARLQVRWRARGADRPADLAVDWIFNCTGPDYDLRRTGDPLFQSLIRAGIVVPDVCGLGLRTGAHGALVESSGRASHDLYCLGPMLRAEHWETTAVAELRAHAEGLATHLAETAPDSFTIRDLFMGKQVVETGIAQEAQPTAPQIDQRVYDLYDEYCHGRIDRRDFLSRSRALVIGGVSALAMAQALLPRYAQAQTISFTDERIRARYVDYPSPGGNSGQMRGYLVQPAGTGPFPAVVVIHENRGLNPYIEDVARRLGVAGFLALAPDGLAPVGGYPGNDDEGRTLQSGLDQAKLRQDLVNSARFVKAHAASSGKLGATGFCFGGGIVNHLAVTLGADLAAGVPFYGAAPQLADVPKIKAALLLQFAATDERINALWVPYEQALKASGVPYEAHVYPGTQHGFHNNSTPRHDEAAANLAWERTLAHFRKHLA